MTDPEKLTALKKAYADIILNTAKEAAARVMISEKKARGFQQELVAVRDEALRTCLRLKQMYDSKVKEAELMSLKKQQKIEELEAQLGEAEDIVGELRMELRESRYLLEKLTNGRQTNLSNEEKTPDEAVSLLREDSSNHERLVVDIGIKPHLSDREFSINRCSYKENKDPCQHTLPSILGRHREGGELEKNSTNNVDCGEMESLTSSKTEARKEEEKENNMELSTTPVSPSEKGCIKFTFKRKRKKDARSSSSSPEGGGSSSQDDESKNRRQKTGEKDDGYLDSLNTESFRDSLRVAQVARQLLPFSEKKMLQQNQCDDVP